MLNQGVEFYQALPKVDLHRHLEGSLRLSTMREVSRTLGLNLPGTGRLRSMVEIQEEEPYTFQNFLSKFETLRLFYRSPEIIARVTREAIHDAAADNVRYMELRFTPVALSKIEGFPLSEVIDWVIAGSKQAARECGIDVGLIVSVNRHESPQIAEKVIHLAIDRRLDGIVGIDLAGNEVHFPALPFADVFQEARQAGLHITVHAGEWGGAQNIAEAIDQLGAERIGHGIRVLEDMYVTALACEHGTIFEVCVTSNYQSGAISKLKDHPLPRMLAAGLKVTVNTDDPSISRITLSDEYRLVGEELGLTYHELHGLVHAGIQAAFVSDEQRSTLAHAFTEKLAPCD